MEPLSNAILRQIQDTSGPSVFIPKDFLGLGEREAVDQVLSRLVKQGKLRRVGRGLYYRPRINEKLGLDVPPDLDELAHAIGRQTGSRIVPSGAVAANRLGISTQVPAKPIFLSDGRTRRVQADNIQFVIRHAAPKDLPAGRPKSAMVFQALRHLGSQAITPQIESTIRKALTSEELNELEEDARYTTDWVATVARRIAKGISHG